MKLKRLKAAIAGLVLSVSGLANAGLIYTETMESGHLTTTSSILSNNITSIIGTLDSDNDVDLFMFWWDGGDFSASIASGFDSQLFLFDSLGLGIIHTDDIDVSAGDSYFTIDLLSNYYFIGISSFSNDPLSIGSLAIFSTDFGTEYPTGPGGASALVAWENDGTSSGDYTLTISQTGTASVPEPATLAIFALGIMGLVAGRFKKQCASG